MHKAAALFRPLHDRGTGTITLRFALIVNNMRGMYGARRAHRLHDSVSERGFAVAIMAIARSALIG